MGIDQVLQSYTTRHYASLLVSTDKLVYGCDLFRPRRSVVYRCKTNNGDPGGAWNAPVDALLPAHGRLPGAARRGNVDEVAFLLGHRDGTVTRTVYVREVADARRRALRRSRTAAEFAGALRLALDGEHGSD